MSKKTDRREVARITGGRAPAGYHEQARSWPLGGKAHEHQRFTPRSWLPATQPRARRFTYTRGIGRGVMVDRSLSAGGGIWWRVRMEALQAKRNRKAVRS